MTDMLTATVTFPKWGLAIWAAVESTVGGAVACLFISSI